VQVIGPQSGVIGNTFAGALNSVEQGTDPDAAWRKALSDIQAAAGTG
jgi:cellobiose transport system substrate-binding protein